MGEVSDLLGIDARHLQPTLICQRLMGWWWLVQAGIPHDGDLLGRGRWDVWHVVLIGWNKATIHQHDLTTVQAKWGQRLKSR